VPTLGLSQPIKQVHAHAAALLLGHGLRLNFPRRERNGLAFVAGKSIADSCTASEALAGSDPTQISTPVTYSPLMHSDLSDKSGAFSTTPVPALS